MSVFNLLPRNSTDPDLGIIEGRGLWWLSQNKPQYIIKTSIGKLAFKSMLEMSVTEESDLPSEPIEKSSFAVYNRVISPLNVKCRLGLQGTDSELQTTLNRLSELRKGTEKLTFITPSATYNDLMLQSFDYRKDEHTGHNVLLVDLTMVEVREVASFQTTSSVTEPEPEVSAEQSADGSCASAEDVGEVQTSYPSDSESGSASSDSSGQSSILHDILGGKV